MIKYVFNYNFLGIATEKIFDEQEINYISSLHWQPMETVLRKTRESTGVNCRNVRRRVRCR